MLAPQFRGLFLLSGIASRILPLAFLALTFHLRAAEPALTGAFSYDGVEEDRVLQRNEMNNTADIELSGKVKSDVADIRVRVEKDFITIPGHEWKSAEKSGGSWKFKISALPVGGPYEIDILAVANDATPIMLEEVHGVLVGDLWVLAGQSNMEGVAQIEGSETPSGVVHMLEMNDVWRLATEPLHNRADSVYPVYWNVGDPSKGKRLTGEAAFNARKNRTRGAGLGLPFAKDLAQKTGVPIGLLPCAYGGTSMDQWNPALKKEGNKSLYGAMMKRIALAGGKVKGVLWYQGESDANPGGSPIYFDKFKTMILAIRSDLKQPDLPFYLVQIGRFVVNGGSPDDWNKVQDAERQIELQVPQTGAVAAIDQDLDDLIHVDTKGQIVVGHRLANLAGIDLFRDKTAYKNLKRGPRVDKITTRGGDKRRLLVYFSGVNGKLVAPGRLSGFVITVDGKTDAAPQPFDQMIDGDNPNAVLLLFQDEVPANAKVHYGRGLNPYCNLTDEAGMGALVMGPMDIQQ